MVSRISVVLLLLAAVFSPLPAQQKLELRPVSPPIPEPKPTSIPAPDDVAAPPADARTTGSGLAWKPLGESEGTGAPPGPNDLVEVRYTGWHTDGTMFDTTELEGETRRFRVNGVIEGFEEALGLLRVGQKARFWVPEELAYGGRPGKPAGTLVFDLELVAVERGPATPPDLAAPPADAVATESGLAWKRLREGDAREGSPGGEDTVLVELDSWTPEGRLLDSSKMRGRPQTFTLNLVIPAFREAFREMVPGERRLLWVPPELTELEGMRVHSEPVVFDVELLSFVRKPVTPEYVSAIPAGAERSETGLAWQVLRPAPEGSAEHPGPGDTVEVQYAGWTRDGKLFDASYNHGQPGRFVLDEAKPLGWNEALYRMVPGEKRLYWIPEELAYGGRADRPQGMLVFEIELLSFERGGLDGGGGSP